MADGFQPAYNNRKKWIRQLEMASVMFGLMWAILYPVLTPFEPVDLQIFLDAGTGRDLNDFFYAPWSLPFFRLLDLLPLTAAFIIANLLSWAGFLLALNVFKGDKVLFFISYPFLMLTYYGQVDGIYAFGLVLMFLSLRRGNDLLASAGWMIAVVKFYVGIPLGAGLWLYFARDNRSRARIVAMMAAWWLLSLVLWPGWIGDLVTRARATPPNVDFSIDLWRYFGPAVLLLWVPVLLSKRRDYVWWVAAWALTVPYIYVWTLTFLIMMPVGLVGWGVMANYFLAPVVGTGFILSTFLQIIPLVVYLRAWAKSWQDDRLMDALRSWKGEARPVAQAEA